MIRSILTILMYLIIVAGILYSYWILGEILSNQKLLMEKVIELYDYLNKKEKKKNV